MKSNYGSIIIRLLAFIAAIFLAVTLLGCNDPIESEIAAEHRRLGSIVERDLRYGLSSFPLTAQAETYRPAP
jgi:hypothetical protein